MGASQKTLHAKSENISEVNGIIKWLSYFFLAHGFSGSAVNAKITDITCALPFLYRKFGLIFQDFVAVNLTVYTLAEFPLRCMCMVND